MFTTGSKYFLGLTGLAAVAAVLYMIFVNPSDLGSVALVSLVAGSGLVGGLLLFTRDATVDSPQAAWAAAARPETASVWPVVSALGAALVFVGVATVPAVFMLGVVVLLLGLAEWLVVDWASRASADNKFNTFVRERALAPIEMPVFAAVFAAVFAFSFSRIMLAIDKVGGAYLFIIVAAGILTVGFLIAFKPGFRGRVAAVVSTVAAVAVIGSGIVGATSGERAQLAKASAEDHYAHKTEEDCGPEPSEHFDKHPSSAVSARSGVLATVTLENGKLSAVVVGIPKAVDTVTVARSNPVTILFRNKDAADRRLLASLGSKMVTVNDTDLEEAVFDCTPLTGKNQENALVLKIDRPSVASTEPYTLTVPGVSGTEIELVVP